MPDDAKDQKRQGEDVDQVSGSWVVTQHLESTSGQRVVDGLGVASLVSVLVVSDAHVDSEDEGEHVVQRVHVDLGEELIVCYHAAAQVLAPDEQELEAQNCSDDEYVDHNVDCSALNQAITRYDWWQEHSQLDVAGHEPGPRQALVVVGLWVQVVNPNQVGPPVTGAPCSSLRELVPDRPEAHEGHEEESKQHGDNIERNVPGNLAHVPLGQLLLGKFAIGLET